MAGGVAVEGLRKRFGDFTALDGVDFTVAPGTVGALLGPNGAGKTTTINVLTTLLAADAGQATVAGYDVATEPHEVRSVIALTGQYAAVDGELTGWENLTMIGRLSRLGWRQARRRADELLERFSLADARDRLVRNYSGGMRRRLDLAASLVVLPAVLFLDEPTTGLDPPSRMELWDVVDQLRGEGTTIVLTTQYLEEADRLADRVSVIDRGRVVADGTAAQLKASFGGQVIEVFAADPTVAEQGGLALCAELGLPSGAMTVQAAEGRAEVAMGPRSLTVVEAVRVLDRRGVPIDDVAVRLPSLDDVFVALTQPGSPFRSVQDDPNEDDPSGEVDAVVA